MDYQISIIVPVYNVEKWLSKCVDSILNQTFTNFELILVDDGSTDNSKKICDEYSLLDSRVVVIHKENCGAGEARNSGLQVARGKYIYFADADDFLDKELLFVLISKINEESLVVCDYFLDNYADGEYLNKGRKTIPSIDSNSDIISELQNNTLLSFLWNKLFISDVIKKRGLYFKDMTLGEDICFVYSYLETIKEIKYIDIPLYHYVKYFSGRVSATQKYVPNYYDKIALPIFQAGKSLELSLYQEKKQTQFSKQISKRFVSDVSEALTIQLAKSSKKICEKWKIILSILNDVSNKEIKINLDDFQSKADNYVAKCIMKHRPLGILLFEELYRIKIKFKERKAKLNQN